MTNPWDGFTTTEFNITRGRIHFRHGGSGYPILMLHGYPQNHEMWRAPAEILASEHHVVVPDLRGYGKSASHSDDYSFRAMADDMLEVMEILGYQRFDVIAHDRGARTAHRMCLDHPNSVRSVALLDILPTLEVWKQMDDQLGMRYYHWLFLAQEGGLPQKLINGDPQFFLEKALCGLGGDSNFIEPEAMDSYREAANRPEVVDAWCRDYRAAATIDRVHDEQNKHETSDIPALILWGKRGTVPMSTDPMKVWRKHFPKATGHGLDAGHFIAEEKAEEVTRMLLDHLDGLK